MAAEVKMNPSVEENDNFIENREKTNREYRLLFPLSFTGTSEEMYNKLESQMVEVEGTNGSVLIQHNMTEGGHNATLAALHREERKTMEKGRVSGPGWFFVWEINDGTASNGR